MYISVFQHAIFSKICNVLMGKKLELVACLCFGLGPAPKAFTKLLKFPISVLRGLMIWVIIFFEDLLIVRHYHGGSTHGTRLCDFSSAALTHYNKLQKIYLGTNSGHSEFLVMVINSKTMALSLTQRKEQKMKNHCLKVFTAPVITLLYLTKLLGKLNFTIKAILPARLQFWYLQ